MSGLLDNYSIHGISHYDTFPQGCEAIFALLVSRPVEVVCPRGFGIIILGYVRVGLC